MAQISDLFHIKFHQATLKIASEMKIERSRRGFPNIEK